MKRTTCYQLAIILAGVLLLHSPIVGMKKIEECDEQLELTKYESEQEEAELSNNDRRRLRAFLKEREREKDKIAGEFQMKAGLSCCALGAGWVGLLFIPVMMGLGAPNADVTTGMLILLGPPAVAGAIGTYLFRRGANKVSKGLFETVAGLVCFGLGKFWVDNNHGTPPSVQYGPAAVTTVAGGYLLQKGVRQMCCGKGKEKKKEE